MQRRTPVFRLARLALCLVALLLLHAPPAQAQPPITVTATPAFEGNYIPGTWLPVEVSLSNAGPPISVQVAVAQPNAAFRNTQRVDLPAGGSQRITLYAAMELSERALALTVESGGAALVEQELAVRPRPDERMLGVLAAEDPALRLPRREDLTRLPFNSFLLTPDALPDRAAGLSSLWLLLVRDLPADALAPAQRDALLAWVSAGGHLVVGGGPDAARTLAQLPPPLQVAALGPQRPVPDAPLAELAAAPGPGPLPGYALAPAPDAEAPGADTPAWATRAVGLGRVTQLAFDPGLPALAAWPGAPQFWDALLQPAALASTPFGPQVGVDILQEQTIGAALTALPAVALPPADLLFLLLAVYAVLIGPGLALLLRRFDRQSLAWLAVPAGALGSGALIFWLALSVRADQRLVNQLSLVEQTAPGSARARTFVGVLSPRGERLAAALSQDALVRPVRPATGQFGSVSGAAGDIAQLGPGAELEVEPWRLQGLVAEQPVPLPPVVAQVIVGPNGPRLELQNNGDTPLRGAAAVFGERVAFMGDVQPGSRAIAFWPAGAPSVPRNSSPSLLILGAELEAGRAPGQAPDRRLIAREALISAAAARGGGLFDAGPLVFAWLDRSPLHVDLQAPGAARGDETLLVLRPTFAGSGPVALPAGWLRPELPAGRSPCYGEQGAGVPLSQAPATVGLRLPAGLAGLRAEQLTLTLESNRTWPNAGVTTELYNWDEGRWVEQAFDGPGDLALAAPAPYLRGGVLQLRLDGQIASAECLYLSAELRGTLP
jgi:hypothetical protein